MDGKTGTDYTEAEMAAAQASLKLGFPRLRFPVKLEAAFSGYYFKNTLKQVRIALMTGIVLYAVFGIVDFMLLSADREHMWFIRYAVVCPVATAGLVFTYMPAFKRYAQPAIWLVMLVGSLGIVAMVHFDPAPEKNFYYTGLLLLIMAAFTFVGMRFWYALTWALATTLAYEAVAIFDRHAALTTIVHNSFCILATINIGTFSNYLMEHYRRRDFLNSILLVAEKQQLLETSDKLHQLSISDELTGLGNRRHLEYRLDQEWMRALRSRKPISLIIFDLDFFKNYNDTYGHQAGDECLRVVAEELGSMARRPGDMAARYGGEEFVLVLPETDLPDAASIAEDCRARVESLGIPHGLSPASVVTLSAGVATMVPDNRTSRSMLLQAADKGLYQAKRDGRNRITFADGTTPESPLPLPFPKHLRSSLSAPPPVSPLPPV
ncbi:diguanylate cyclase [Geotalea sp. SG265]|uniref:diguanylate cyclase n=1 Tax=Geotalea sp. SG265 TaxID=2922867 RepID=UPI001FAE7B47|nr:diguanylate cyclase [Geotalea sp. SG265]